MGEDGWKEGWGMMGGEKDDLFINLLYRPDLLGPN